MGVVCSGRMRTRCTIPCGNTHPTASRGFGYIISPRIPYYGGSAYDKA